MVSGPAKVLVVGDDPDVTVLRDGLNRVGYPSATVATPIQAIAAIADDGFAFLVISEEALPEGRQEFFDVLRANGDPSVIVAGWNEKTSAQILLDGADLYLTRPIPDIMLKAWMGTLENRVKRADAWAARRRRPSSSLQDQPSKN